MFCWSLFVLLRYTDSDYSFGIFWPLYCLFFFNIQILITPLVSFGHCVVNDQKIPRRYSEAVNQRRRGRHYNDQKKKYK
jgi:hypothetical protein